jgi:hypothetical protein
MDEQQSGASRLVEVLARAWTQHKLRRVETTVLQLPSEANRWTTVVQATVDTERGTFSAIGDANAENVPPELAPHAVRVAENRAVMRALGWATNTAAAVGEELTESEAESTKRQPAAPRETAPAPVRETAPAPVEVPEFLAAEPKQPRAAQPEQTPAPEPPPAAQPATPSRVFTTAQTLWRACTNLGLAAPEPEAAWDDKRLQEYVDTWSAELRRAKAGSATRR